jgi:hypothetical protein
MGWDNGWSFAQKNSKMKTETPEPSSVGISFNWKVPNEVNPNIDRFVPLCLRAPDSRSLSLELDTKTGLVDIRGDLGVSEAANVFLTYLGRTLLDEYEKHRVNNLTYSCAVPKTLDILKDSVKQYVNQEVGDDSINGLALQECLRKARDEIHQLLDVVDRARRAKLDLYTIRKVLDAPEEQPED